MVKPHGVLEVEGASSLGSMWLRCPDIDSMARAKAAVMVIDPEKADGKELEVVGQSELRGR
jgi:hypothetical protein